MATALLVVDMQRSLLAEGPWRSAELTATVRRLAARARAARATVVFIRDTRVHPDGAVANGLDPADADWRIRKDFCDAFLGTDLDARLRASGIGRLAVCGLQTDYCIDTTCRRAASLGYDVQLADDAHSTFDGGGLAAAQIIDHHNRILRDFRAGAGCVRTLAAAAVRFD